MAYKQPDYHRVASTICQMFEIFQFLEKAAERKWLDLMV